VFFAPGADQRPWRLPPEYSGKIELLLSDVQVPEMSDPQLGDALKQVRPDIHVMFMSLRQSIAGRSSLRFAQT
jgi:DNA-binding NarL/FixJ family response regulator